MAPRSAFLLCSILCWLPAASIAAGIASKPAVLASLEPEPVFGGEAYLLEAGRENPRSIVLVHGLGDSGSDDWARLVPLLARTHHVVAFDLPGLGRSTKSCALYSPANLAAFVEHVVEQRVRGDFTLVGHSLGGAVALYYAATSRRPPAALVLADVVGILQYEAFVRELARSAIEGALPRSESVAPRIARLLAGAIPVFELDRDFVQSADTRALLLDGDPRRIAALALVLEDFGPLLPRVSIPTLLVWGSKDVVAPRRTLEVLADRLANSQVEVLDGVGHFLPHEAPERLASLILDISQTGAVRPRAPERELTSTRVGRCSRRTGVVFEGDYDTIEIDHCRDAVLRSVRAHRVTIVGSTAALEHTRILGNDVALMVHRSSVTVTGGGFEAEVAVCASRSELDLAGTRLIGRAGPIASPNRARFLFSVTTLESPDGVAYAHGVSKASPRLPSLRTECSSAFKQLLEGMRNNEREEARSSAREEAAAIWQLSAVALSAR